MQKGIHNWNLSLARELQRTPSQPIYFRLTGYLSQYSTELRAERPGFNSRQGLEIFLFSIASRPALGPTQPLIECVPAAVSPGVERPGPEADYSPPSGAEVNNGAAIPPHPHTSTNTPFTHLRSCLYSSLFPLRASSYVFSLKIITMPN
jgi:hypothetical protein